MSGQHHETASHLEFDIHRRLCISGLGRPKGEAPVAVLASAHRLHPYSKTAKPIFGQLQPITRIHARRMDPNGAFRKKILGDRSQHDVKGVGPAISAHVVRLDGVVVAP